MNTSKAIHNLTTNLYVKIAMIGMLIGILLVPAKMIEHLIEERQYRQIEAHEEISSKWGSEQTLTGPVLTIPYDTYLTKKTGTDETAEVVRYSGYAHFLPEELKVTGQLNPQKRYRGLYEIVVYDSRVELSGVFAHLDLDEFRGENIKLHADRAFVSMGISDLKGLEDQIALNWNDEMRFFNSGTISTDVVAAGIHCPVRLGESDSASYAFSLALDLKGSDYLHFVPVGKTTDIRMTSDWPNPSFDGEFLPDTREVSDAGFRADWHVLHLNRNFPQSWKGNTYDLQGSAFGVNLMLQVDVYQKTMRVIKYAVLFITLTFLIFFFVEILNRVYIHPIQYGLVGIALVIFFTLLLSFSEHIRFNTAYLIAAGLTIGLISGYVKSILKSVSLALLLAGILSTLYAFIFIIIQLQDYTLLFGSLGIFMILALTMYFSRKIDWYAIGKGPDSGES